MKGGEVEVLAVNDGVGGVVAGWEGEHGPRGEVRHGGGCCGGETEWNREVSSGGVGGCDELLICRIGREKRRNSDSRFAD